MGVAQTPTPTRTGWSVMSRLGEWLDRIPAVWKALLALAAAAACGASIAGIVIGGLSVPEQVHANTLAIRGNTVAISENTQTIADLQNTSQAWRDTVISRFAGVEETVILSICEQRQLHEATKQPLTRCIQEVRNSLKSMRSEQ